MFACAFISPVIEYCCASGCAQWILCQNKHVRPADKVRCRCGVLVNLWLCLCYAGSVALNGIIMWMRCYVVGKWSTTDSIQRTRVLFVWKVYCCASINVITTHTHTPDATRAAAAAAARAKKIYALRSRSANRLHLRLKSFNFYLPPLLYESRVKILIITNRAAAERTTFSLIILR